MDLVGEPLRVERVESCVGGIGSARKVTQVPTFNST